MIAGRPRPGSSICRWVKNRKGRKLWTDEDETSDVEEKTSKSVIISSIAVKSGDGKLIEKEGVASGNQHRANAAVSSSQSPLADSADNISQDTVPFAPGLQITGLTERVFSGFRLAQAMYPIQSRLCQPESGEHALQ
ncbi:unnamed protein product [Nippostrongylus brasiliensis]|uniref:Uncharacterized protein n=1 Tax=Nippostrongylus brasiliensis TaxID=27835 RepID=A0A0N4YLI3_NIPBR|nr:unnamed protein product [Nippostrongylus brasiliensis]